MGEEQTDQVQPPPWTECMVHPIGTDTDCEYCQNELNQKNTVLQGINADCQTLDRRLAQLTGTPFLAMAPAVVHVKIDTLVGMILNDPKHRMAYEINVMNRLREIMQNTETQLARQRILSGVNGHPAANKRYTPPRG